MKKQEEESGTGGRNKKMWLPMGLTCISVTKWYFHMRLMQAKGHFRVNLNFGPKN